MSDQIMKAAEQLSSMADKVAGFAISSYLLLIFACLKDIGPWLRDQSAAFAIGAGVAGVAYIAAVWCLYFGEVHVFDTAKPPGGLDLLANVGFWLAVARSLGIAVFAAIGILAVFGARKGAKASSARADDE